MFKRITIAALLSVGSFSVYAEDDSGTLFKNLLSGAGILSKEKNIDYRERAPLVVPPNLNNLPSPQDPISKRATNWPKDPDVLKEQEKNRKTRSATTNTNRPLTPEEMARIDSIQRGRGIVNNYPVEEVKPFKNDGPGLFSGMKRSFNDEKERITFKGEEPRNELIQPPPGYRTPSANQPYGPTGKTNYDRAPALGRDPNAK